MPCVFSLTGVQADEQDVMDVIAFYEGDLIRVNVKDAVDASGTAVLKP